VFWNLFLLVVAFVLAVIEAFVGYAGIPQIERVKFGWLALAFYFLSIIVGGR
jgi:hypothetical protein